MVRTVPSGGSIAVYGWEPGQGWEGLYRGKRKGEFRKGKRMVKNYKCPGCGASMVFKEGSDSMECPYCGRTVSIKEAQQEERSEPEKEEPLREETGEQAAGEGAKRREAGEADWEQEEHVRTFHCPNCGAEMMTDENTAATFCSFCGSPTLIEERLSGVLKPKYLIPFQIDKEKARDMFASWTKKGIFTPRAFSSASALDKVTGMYVPYWLYDYEAYVDLDAAATRVHSTRRGDTEYTYTDHYRVHRAVSAAYEKVPEDASVQMPDDVMERLEPFHYDQIREFDMPYLTGFLAEKYNDDKEKMKSRAEERVRKFAVNETMGTIQGYATVSVVRQDVNLQQRNQDYAMLPVWILNYQYRKKPYMLMINGQTGKMIGKLPLDYMRVGIGYVLIAAVVFFLLTLLGMVI